MPAKLDIAEQLRRAIVDSRETYAALFLATGVTQSVVSRFVSGERDITMGTAAKLATYLRLHLTYRD